MNVLVIGSRSLSSKHLDVMRLVVRHAVAAAAPPLPQWLKNAERYCGTFRPMPLSEGASILLMHGDDRPSKRSGSIGAGKLAECAARVEWQGQWAVRRFPVEHAATEEPWEAAADRRNAAFVAAKPHRVYCVHPRLDSSGGSLATAKALTKAGIRFWHVQVTVGGGVIGVEER